MIEKITKLIQNKEMTEKQFLKEAGLTASAMSEWRKGKAKPSLDAIFKIAEYFNCSVDYLLGRTDNPEINRTAPEEEYSIAALRKPKKEISENNESIT